MHIERNKMQKPTHLITQKITQALLISGVILISNKSFAYYEAPNSAAKSEAELVQPAINSEDTQQAEKIKARVAEVNAEIQATAKAANIEKNGYYVERKSYGTGRETEPPRYVKQLNKTWLGEYDAITFTFYVIAIFFNIRSFCCCLYFRIHLGNTRFNFFGLLCIF